MRRIDQSLVSEARSRNMSAIRASGTKLEAEVGRALWHRGVRFRRNVKGLMGCPDLSVRKYRIVVFIDSCFWHGCPEHCNMPRNNAEFWAEKLVNNRRRDAIVTDWYRSQGWHIMRVWEHDLSKDFEGTLDLIEAFVRNAKSECQKLQR